MNKPAILTFFLAAASSLLAQGTLTVIGPAIRNGSFEDGVLPPWTTAAGTASVIQDSSLATQGERLAVVSQTVVSSIARPSVFHRLGADPNNGMAFTLAFDARNGTSPFDGIRVFFAVLDSNNIVVFTTNRFFALPSSGWEIHQAEYQLATAWGRGQISLGLQFEEFGAVVGTTYTGYLDNIVPEQIPEPSSLALLGLGAGLVLAARQRRGSRWGSGHPGARDSSQ